MRVQLADLERAVTAGGAAAPADDPGSTAAHGLGHGGVNDLEQLGIRGHVLFAAIAGVAENHHSRWSAASPVVGCNEIPFLCVELGVALEVQSLEVQLEL